MTRPELSQGMPAGLTQSLANIGYLFSSLENEACCYGVPEEGGKSSFLGSAGERTTIRGPGINCLC